MLVKSIYKNFMQIDFLSTMISYFVGLVNEK